MVGLVRIAEKLPLFPKLSHLVLTMELELPPLESHSCVITVGPLMGLLVTLFEHC